MMTPPHLALYYFDSCPFCQIVLKVIDKLDLDVEMRDISMDQNHLARLTKDTGRRTVPCLYIDDKPMHESADIIQWLQKNVDQLKKAQ
jgi:glutaredoxin 3